MPKASQLSDEEVSKILHLKLLSKTVKEISELLNRSKNKPVWVNPDADTFYAVVGSTGSLMCEARSEPSPTFEWFKGRALLGNSKTYKIINEKYKSTLQ
ncbi:hypothetical protein AVEN_225654-1, partial [Araneus ventricosus]